MEYLTSASIQAALQRGSSSTSTGQEKDPYKTLDLVPIKGAI
jgi:hypothetical protein